MKNIIIIFILSFIFYSVNCSAQKQKDTTDTYKFYARMQMDSLKKQGAIIILLKSKSRAMEAYEKAGNSKLVSEMTEKMNKQNLKMVKSYINYWNFCPFYFLYLKDLSAFNKGQRSNIFVDSTLNINDSIIMKESFYIYLDFGPYYEVQNIPEGKWSNSKIENIDPNEGTPVRQDCIVAKDRDMKQFREPFPCYAQTWSKQKIFYDEKKGLKYAISDANIAILNLNTRFHYFHDKGKEALDIIKLNQQYQSIEYFKENPPSFYYRPNLIFNK